MQYYLLPNQETFHWEKINEILSNPITNSKELRESIEAIMETKKKLSGLKKFFANHIDQETHNKIFQKIIPFIISQIKRTEELFPEGKL
ncbi:poly adp-ribose glycohydrolase [Anaeramoeba ignava]|uniref:Poly adp-ribose glycohydrolase n=1 Tax=Anaeramoeba ignava TaxID=1746090 RepID=A0A9Q0R9W4_ANAIG|nr:poly adp-ribose glycohydrolase [Anaeramoeba ignava]